MGLSFALLVALVPAPALAADTGPELSVPEAALAASLHCPRPLAGATRAPVLLIPGTDLKPQPNFDWNYQPALDRAGIPWCAVELPRFALADIQVSAEHVVHALRRMSAQAGRRVSIIGWSQGGMIGRWATKYWPDTRELLEDLVGLAPSNHGTTSARTVCQTSCPPAFWQQRDDAKFIAALNTGPETWAGIDYTVAFTRYDQIVMPNADARTGSSALRTGEGRISNTLLQDICPNNMAEHFALGSYDPVGYALALDAITHDGPADAARLDRAVCGQPFMPGVNPVTFPADYARFVGTVAPAQAQSEYTPGEPPLRCYVTRTCAGEAGAEAGAAPEVRGLRATRRCVRSPTLTSPRAGTKGLSFRFSLSADATVRYVIARRDGSPRWTFCPPRGGTRAGTYDTVSRSRGDGREGRNDTSLGTTSSRRTGRARLRHGSRRLSLARIASRRRLAPGTYLLRVHATNAAGRSAEAKVKFWVLGRKP